MLAEDAIEDSRVIKRGGDISVKFAMQGLVNFQSLQIHRFRLHMLSLAGIDLRQL
ncbi:MAG: hypothetical protein L0Z46_09395 [Nitrospiraceae bacterium]|nr:hypothetical protein [Nitrospiraceae bacterium]